MFRLLILAFAFVVSTPLWADHMAGGHFEYEYLSDNNYKVRFYFLRDCEGIEVVPPVLLMESVSCGYECDNIGPMTLISTTPVDYGCGNTCEEGASEFKSYELYVFERSVTFPDRCPDWKLNVSIGARNVVDFMSGGKYFNYIIINNMPGIVNNSPVFTGYDVVLGCLNEVSVFNNTWTDSEGDLVSFSFNVPQVTLPDPNYCESQDVVFSSPAGHTLSDENVYPSEDGIFSIDPSSGTFTFMPVDFTGSSYFSIKIQEYRDGVLLSESFRDGQIITTNCAPSDDIEISDWSGSGTDLEEATRSGEDCFSFSVDGSDDIVSLSIPDMPNSFSYNVSGLGTDDVTVTVCVEEENLEPFCNDSIFVFNVIAQSDPCLFESLKTKKFRINMEGSPYCNEYRFLTNRNPTSGVPFPTYAIASNSIWVGDDMPAFSGIDPADMGQVIITEDFLLEAGVEIVIPSCVVGDACVTITGVNQTLKIGPVDCSPECPVVPLDVEIDRVFECANEHVIAKVNDGVPPFSFSWFNSDDLIIGSDSILHFHDTISSAYWTDTVYLRLYIEDANGDIYESVEYFNGTQRFYEPITNNMFLYTHADGFDWYDDSTYLYAYNPLVNLSGPFVIYDDINSSPPWYGATKMDLWIFDRWGAVSYENHINLEDEINDWSIDNYELYWDGTPNNNGEGIDCYDAADVVYGDYRLTASNCIFPVHEEIDIVYFGGCWIGDFSDSIWTTYSALNDFGGLRVINDPSNILGQAENDIDQVTIYPNPTNNFVVINGVKLEIREINLFDLQGQKVLHAENSALIDVNYLSPGAYLIEVITSKGRHTRKLIIQ